MKKVNFKINLEELKKLNPKTIYSWPLIPKMMVFMAISFLTVVGGYFAYLAGKGEELEKVERQEVTLKEDFITNKKQAINLSVYENQLVEIENTFGTLLKQLPNKTEMESLINDINQAGLARSLQFELFRPAMQEKQQEFYAELPIDIKVTGSFNDIGNFASEIGGLSRVVVLSDVSLVSTKEDTVTMEAKAKTFRYLDEDEIEKQRKEKQEADKKKKKAEKAAEPKTEPKK